MGYTSFKTNKAKEDMVYHKPAEAMKVTNRIGVLRHPMARLRSMYRWVKYARLHSNGPLINNTPADNYEQFIDYTFTHYNQHWQHQHILLETPEGEFIPTYTHRFEDVDKFWPLYFDNQLPHKNRSPEYKTSDYREVELLTKYHRDLTLWTISEMRDDREGLQFIS